MITLLVGPHYSYLMKQSDVFTTPVANVTQEQVFSQDNIRKNTFGFIAGADVNVDRLVISGRLGWDVQNNNGDGTTTTPQYKNIWLQGTVGLRF